MADSRPSTALSIARDRKWTVNAGAESIPSVVFAIEILGDSKAIYILSVERSLKTPFNCRG